MNRFANRDQAGPMYSRVGNGAGAIKTSERTFPYMTGGTANLGRQLFKGAAWTMTMRLALRLIGLVSTIILARLPRTDGFRFGRDGDGDLRRPREHEQLQLRRGRSSTTSRPAGNTTTPSGR